MQDSASFWTDIKAFEDQLASLPDSFCFAKLSDVYLKVGLIDDALHVARRGCMIHPRYLSGLRALSEACHAKGLDNEAIITLKAITEAMPEDISSQKLLGRLLFESGDRNAACYAFRSALEFAPDDVECRIELESIELSMAEEVATAELDEDDEVILDDLEILEELEIFEDNQEASELPFQGITHDSDTPTALLSDPLSTSTLAELYVSQGFIRKALGIYRLILIDNPNDQLLANRVAELEEMDSSTPSVCSELDNAFDVEEDEEDEPVCDIPAVEVILPSGEITLSEADVAPVLENKQVCSEVTNRTNGTSNVSSQWGADAAISILDKWLGNIRRIKSCR